MCVLGSAHMTEAGAVAGMAGGSLGSPCLCTGQTVQLGQERQSLTFADSGPRQGCTYREM